MGKEQYMCQLCANHGIFNQPKKGHKQKCDYKTCPCEMCALNTKRRTLDQIERQLRTITPPQISESTDQQHTPLLDRLDVENRQAVNFDKHNKQRFNRYFPYSSTRKPVTSIFTSIKLLVDNA